MDLVSFEPYRQRTASRKLFYAYRVAWHNRSLIKELAIEDVRRAYRNTFLGLFWLFVHPVLFAGSFVLVRYVLMGRAAGDWSISSDLPPSLLLTSAAIFIGFVVYWVASECLARSTTLIRQNANVLTEIPFPAEVLPWVVMVSALVNTVIRVLILMPLLLWLHKGLPPLEALFLPLTFLPLVLLALGATFICSALAPFLRDIEIVMASLLGSLLILSGVIFSVADLPEPIQHWILLNPITLAIEQARYALLFGQIYGWERWLAMTVVGVILIEVGVVIFMKARKRFSDVL